MTSLCPQGRAPHLYRYTHTVSWMFWTLKFTLYPRTPSHPLLQKRKWGGKAIYAQGEPPEL